MTVVDRRKKSRHVLILIFVFLFTIGVFHYRHELNQLSYYGYAGIFVACFAANSTVFLPAPSSAVVFVMASIYLPFAVGTIGGLGASAGEIMGYLAGYSGRAMISTDDQARKVRNYVEQYGAMAVFVFAFLPLPLFDLVGIAAGALHLSFARFIFPCIAGKVLKMLMYAYLGAGVLPMITPYIEDLTKQLLQ